MPRPKLLSSYPVESIYPALARGVHEPFVMPVEPGKAISMRQYLNAFRRACERYPTEAAALGVDLAVLRSLYFSIVPEGVRVGPATEHPIVAALAKALGGAVPTAVEAAATREADQATASLARIMEAMKGSQHG